MSATECTHAFRYRGRYGVRGRRLAGSGADEVRIWDLYFCERCLAFRYAETPSHSNTYEWRGDYARAPRVEEIVR